MQANFPHTPSTLDDTKQAELFRRAGFDAIAIFDVSGHCVESNDILLHTFSLSKKDILGKKSTFFIAKEDHHKIPKITKSKQRYTFQCQASCNNVHFPALIQCKKIALQKKTLTVISIRNITKSREIRKRLERAHAQLDTIFANSMVGISLVNAKRIILRANNFFSETLGYGDPKNIEGMHARELYFDQNAFDQFGQYYENFLRENKKIEMEALFRKKDGSPILGKIVGRAVDQNDLDKGIIWISEDITEKRKTERKLQETHNELATIFENSLVGIVVLRGGRTIHHTNQRMADILGYKNADELIGKSYQDFHLSKESATFFGKRFFARLVDNEQLQVEYQFKRKDGSPIWLSLSGKALDKNSPPDLNKGVLWMVEDASKRKAAEERLYQLAHTDELTGIHNRRNFFSLAHGEFEKSLHQQSPISLLMLDIDHFKHVNDSFGHAAGDQTLKLFCLICSEQLLFENIFGRLGGEEFAILFPNTQTKKAKDIAETIREAVANDHRFRENALPRITVSIGVATTTGTDTIDALLIRADKRLYQAKQQGRNRVVSN